ncbi:MAG: His/Gly/Thr/Pro-type tRNA ligase C-terminal domain-containing protein, partial [Planctomycetota bacterium]
QKLKAAGVDACLDDRPLSPGAKFKDHELLGFPVQIFVGRRAAEGFTEFLLRRGMQKSEVAVADLTAQVLAALGR